MEFEINGFTVDSTLFWIVIAIAGLALGLALVVFGMWVYYSLIKRNNSKNWTGADLTRHVLDDSGLKNVEVKRAWIFAKYWNYNKKRQTHKLKPWTYGRKSIWTLMEASQQAYATKIREEKGKTFWLLFRMPAIIRVIGAILAFAMFWLIWDHDDSKVALAVGIAAGPLLIAFFIADAGKLYILWKNVIPMLEKSGLTKEELKAIKRIFFVRLLLAIVNAILEIIRLAIQINEAVNNNKSRR